MQESKDREEVLTLLSTELNTYKNAITESLSVMTSEHPDFIEESTLAPCLTAVTNALTEELFELRKRYERESEWKVSERERGNTQGEMLTEAEAERDIGNVMIMYNMHTSFTPHSSLLTSHFT